MTFDSYIQERGFTTTTAETAKSLQEALQALYGGVLTPIRVLASPIECKRFCAHLRGQWAIDAPDEMILDGLRAAVTTPAV